MQISGANGAARMKAYVSWPTSELANPPLHLFRLLKMMKQRRGAARG